MMTLPTEDKNRKQDWPLWTFMFEYFPKAWLEVVRVAVEGNKQHNPGQKLHWAREKSTDQLNTAFRHLFDYGTGVKKDTDGVYHLAKAIWRLSAQLQLDVEADEKAAEPRTGARDTSQEVPAGIELVRCACGARLFHLNAGAMAPNVFDPKDKLYHSPGGCK